jgi:plastocyanin
MSGTISRRKVLRLGVTSTTGAAALLSVLGSGLAFGQAQAGASVTTYILRGAQGIKGPDGKGHDAFVPSSFVLQAGVPTTFTVINYDGAPHTITSRDLGLNLPINPGNPVGDDVQPVTTTATITIPQAGVYRWYCDAECDDDGGKWAMSDGYDGKAQDGFMAGNFVVL